MRRTNGKPAGLTRLLSRLKPGVNVYLESKYFHKCILGTLTLKRKIENEHSPAGDVLGRGTEAHVAKTLLHEAPMDGQNKHATIRMAKHITFQPKSNPS